MAANYKNYPTLSLLVQAGGWMEVNKILGRVQKIIENMHVYTAFKTESRIDAPDVDGITRLLRPRRIDTMNLFGYVNEVARLDREMAELTASVSGDRSLDFDGACIRTLDEINLPPFLKAIMDRLFTTDTPLDKNCFIFEAENFPYYKLHFKDRDTLVDFANKCRLEGVIYKHVETVEYDKCQGYVDDEDYDNITREKRIEFLADALRLLPFAITPDTNDKYLFHTPDDGRYLVLTENEERDYAKKLLAHEIHTSFTNGIYDEYITARGRETLDNGLATSDTESFMMNKELFDLDKFFDECFEGKLYDIICKNKKGIVILIQNPITVTAYPQDNIPAETPAEKTATEPEIATTANEPTQPTKTRRRSSTKA